MESGLEIHLCHEHDHQERLLDDLLAIIETWSGLKNNEVENNPKSLDDAREALNLLKEDTYEHFEREEHGLFSNLRTDYPELGTELDAMTKAHDVICRQLEALDEILNSATDNSPLTVRADAAAAIKRLEVLQKKHTQHEWGVISRLLERLDDARRSVILQQLREL